MAASVPQTTAVAHRVFPETPARGLKAGLKKLENSGSTHRVQVGALIDRARNLLGWSKKELAAAVKRDEAQVNRWIAGTERAQWDALIAVEELRGPLTIAQAEIAAGVEVMWEIRVRRKAAL